LRPTVSVIICAKDVEKYIGKCIKSILGQSFKDFELLIIDDMSCDSTPKIIKEFEDGRIKYLRNEEWLGIARSRNKGLKHATGEYIFFTDSDCTVCESWIEEGLKYFRYANCIGVEGRVYYVSEDYKHTFSDHFVQNRCGGQFMTGSIAYRKDAIINVRGFDEKLTYFEDRDIALRIMKQGRICFNPNMIAYHPQVVRTPKQLIASAALTRNRVLIFKKFGEEARILSHTLLLFNLATILFPPLILANLIYFKFTKPEDFRLLPFAYIYAILERLQLWKECARERVFLI
jgi:glycosyltransferase involved in cell wall biosynthesis